MTKYYIAALAIATALNIFYTVYSYNEINKWRQSVDSRIENTVERVNHIEDRANSIDNSIDTSDLKEQIKEVQSQVSAKIDDKLVDQINRRMLETMMSLEARVYELELKDIEQKLRESTKK